MKEQVIVVPEKLARKMGGDRYVGQLQGGEWKLYLPQAITRAEGMPAKEILITIETKEAS